LPGRHITDCQTRLYMKSRRTNGPAIAAAKAGLSIAPAYRIEADPRFQGSPRATVDFRRIMLKRLHHTGSTLRSRSIPDKAAIAQAVERG
jgi:hypothetical protein